MKAIRIQQTGGPEVMQYVDVPHPVAGPGQVVVDLEAIGVNFTEVLTRNGVSAPAAFPAGLGREGAGVISQLGPGAGEFRVGDRVAFCSVTSAYQDRLAVEESRLVKLPPKVDSTMGAAVLLQGLTAHYLVRSICPNLGPGDAALVHAGAGGTGLLLIQLLKRVGVHVFATVSTEAKAAIAKDAGADQTILYTKDDFRKAVLDQTGGLGVRVVYESVGQSTFEGSVACVARRGYLVLYGRASGDISPRSPYSFLDRSKYVMRPTLGDFTADRAEFLWRCGEVLDLVGSGALKLRYGGVFPLAQAAEAHRRLQMRETTGKLLLIP